MAYELWLNTPVGQDPVWPRENIANLFSHKAHRHDLFNGRFGIPDIFSTYVGETTGREYTKLLGLSPSFTANQTMKEVLRDLTNEFARIEKLINKVDILTLLNKKNIEISAFFETKLNISFQMLTNTTLRKLQNNLAFASSRALTSDFISSLSNVTMKDILFYKYNNSKFFSFINKRSLLLLSRNNILEFTLGRTNEFKISQLLDKKYYFYRSKIPIKNLTDVYKINISSILSKPLLYFSEEIIGMDEDAVKRKSNLNDMDFQLLEKVSIAGIHWALQEENLTSLSVGALEQKVKEFKLQLFFITRKSLMEKVGEKIKDQSLGETLFVYFNGHSQENIVANLLSPYRSSDDFANKSQEFVNILKALKSGNFQETFGVDMRLDDDTSVKDHLQAIYQSK